jgi:D-glycero-D-manno-heptose 1,7-bisphosphate phosphatase
MVHKAVFLDSDGVLNKALIKAGKPVAPVTMAEFIIPPDVRPALEKLKTAGYLLICVTNKPDVAEGIMTQAFVDQVYKKMRLELPLDDIFICYDRAADCYKPKPGLLLSAAKKYAIDLNQSYLIGDRWRDIGAGQNAHCKTIWIDSGYTNDKIPSPPADYTVYSLSEAVDIIRQT